MSGEESAEQVRLRAERLVLNPAGADTDPELATLPRENPARLQVPILAETDLQTVLGTLDSEAPEVCVIDSVQTSGTPPS